MSVKKLLFLAQKVTNTTKYDIDDTYLILEHTGPKNLLFKPHFDRIIHSRKKRVHSLKVRGKERAKYKIKKDFFYETIKNKF